MNLKNPGRVAKLDRVVEQVAEDRIEERRVRHDLWQWRLRDANPVFRDDWAKTKKYPGQNSASVYHR